MSHYSVCVAIPASRLEGGEMSAWRIESILDEILAPYDEGPVSEEYLEFQDKTEECREGYHKDTRTAVRFPDGSVHSAFAEEVTRRFVLREGKLLEKVNGCEVETDNTRTLELLQDYPVEKLYTFEKYCEEYCGYEQVDERWGYWRNPRAKWDWFSIGGRFDGDFLVKKDAPSAIDTVEDDQSPDYLRADGARMGEIEWEEMRRRAFAAVKRDYEKLVRACESGQTKEFGPLVSCTADGIYSWNHLLYRKGESLEEYRARMGLSEGDRYRLSCYAFADLEGEWHSQGDMGWFGLSANDKEERTWHDEIQAFAASVGKQDYLVMVDCHI